MARLWDSVRTILRRDTSPVPRLEVHVPISPTPTFFRQVRLFTQSLRMFGGRHRDAPVVVTVGHEPADASVTAALDWVKALGIEFRWVPADLFRSYSYLATAMQRLRHDHRADVVLLVDADVLVAGPFDRVVARVGREGGVAGCLAHMSPFGSFQSPADWGRVFRHCGLPPPRLRHRYAGWPLMGGRDAPRDCPAYFNFGAAFFARDAARRVGERIFTVLDRLNQLEPSYFNGQIGLAVLIAELGVPYRCLPFRYNAANWPALHRLYPREVRHARLLHLITGKAEIYRDRESVRRFIGRGGLVGVDRRAAEVLGAVCGAAEADTPEPLAGLT